MYAHEALTVWILPQQTASHVLHMPCVTGEPLCH
jgi:hypothetical protein